ncbi:MAG: hypothetical protein M3065_05890 [Actinomycetota bacterium]|nr:hypothetical protein [Actinomycetota bacterium]
MKHRDTVPKPPASDPGPMFYALQLPGWAARHRASEAAPRRGVARLGIARRRLRAWPPRPGG